MYLVGLLIFIVSSGLCGLAQNIEHLRTLADVVPHADVHIRMTRCSLIDDPRQIAHEVFTAVQKVGYRGNLGRTGIDAELDRGRYVRFIAVEIAHLDDRIHCSRAHQFGDREHVCVCFGSGAAMCDDEQRLHAVASSVTAHPGCL